MLRCILVDAIDSLPIAMPGKGRSGYSVEESFDYNYPLAQNSRLIQLLDSDH